MFPALTTSDPPSALLAGIRRMLRRLGRNPTLVVGGLLLGTVILASILAPVLGSADGMVMRTSQRLRPPSWVNPFGTDSYGRDIFTRTLWGGRISLVVGLSVAFASTLLGLAIGLVAGYVRWLDSVVMRIMDGMMAIPGILFAIAIMALTQGSVVAVILAITVVEIPRVVRLIRSVVLALREQPYVEAAIAVGTPLPWILLRHILPNALGPMIVQATFICGAAILIEASLSFLGVGTPPTTPTWGNIIADGRNVVHRAPWAVLLPGVFLGATILGFNLLGDWLRGRLDPRLARVR